MVEGASILSVACSVLLCMWGITRLKRIKSVVIVDFQRGVRFRKGVFRDEIGAGAYTIDSQKEQILIMDLRPRLILIERQGYQDALQSPTVVSMAGELLVSNAHLAATKLKDPVNDAMPLVRDALINCGKQNITDDSTTGRQRLSDLVTAATNQELAKVGMRIANVEITELWCRQVHTAIGATAN
jgi:SPFH domain/Band 7 family protein